jgi:hypothetical protein
LARIVWNASPVGWKKAQVQANLRHLSLSAQTQYYTGLKNVEFTEANPNRNKTNDNQNPNQQKNRNPTAVSKTNTDTGNKSSQSHKFCEIHGKCGHTTSQCKVILKQRSEY